MPSAGILTLSVGTEANHSKGTGFRTISKHKMSNSTW